jgi:hydrogenase/urease accessory protein HupE
MGDGEVALRFPFPIGWVVPYCLVTALASGLIVDLLRPFARSRVAGASVGFAASVPLSFGYMVVAARDVLARPNSAIIVITMFGLTYGVAIGAMYWEPLD